MIKHTKVTEGGKVSLPDTFTCGVGTNTDVDVHFGARPQIIVIVAKGFKLDKDSQDRIKLLIGATREDEKAQQLS